MFLPNLLLETAYSSLVIILLLVKLLNEPSRVILPVTSLSARVTLVTVVGISIFPLIVLFAITLFFAAAWKVTLPNIVLLVTSESGPTSNRFAVLLYAFEFAGTVNFPSM